VLIDEENGIIAGHCRALAAHLRVEQLLDRGIAAFATNLVREGSHASVIATFRLAIAEATRSPEIAQALGAARNATSGTLADLLASVQGTGLIGPGEPAEMAAQLGGAEGGVAARDCHDARASRH
jgi:hypothetical protein